MAEIDIEVSNGGSIYMFTPLTGFARDWVSENISLESWQWIGSSFAVESRFAADLAQVMTDDGLEVR